MTSREGTVWPRPPRNREVKGRARGPEVRVAVVNMPTVRDRNLKKLRRMKQKARLKIKAKMMNDRQPDGMLRFALVYTVPLRNSTSLYRSLCYLCVLFQK